jgi:hypothetical protein
MKYYFPLLCAVLLLGLSGCGPRQGEGTGQTSEDPPGPVRGDSLRVVIGSGASSSVSAGDSVWVFGRDSIWVFRGGSTEVFMHPDASSRVPAADSMQASTRTSTKAFLPVLQLPSPGPDMTIETCPGDGGDRTTFVLETDEGTILFGIGGIGPRVHILPETEGDTPCPEDGWGPCDLDSTSVLRDCRCDPFAPFVPGAEACPASPQGPLPCDNIPNNGKKDCWNDPPE